MAFTTPVADGTTFGSLTIAGAQVPTNAFVDANGNDAVAALLAAFGPLATDAHVQAIATLLGAPLPLATGAATDAKLEAVRQLLAATLTVNLPTGAATDAKLEAIRQLLAAPLPIATGAATDAKLETIRQLLAVPLPLATGAATDAKLEAIRLLLAATLTVNLPAGAATAANQTAQIVRGSESYALASAVTLAANAGSTPVSVPYGGYYFFDTFFTGSSPSLALQVLGSDGATWITVVTVTATGAAANPVGIPSGAQVRLYNSGTGALTGVSGRLA